MNLYQIVIQYVTEKGWRESITSGNYKNFIKAYKKGDLNKGDLLKIYKERLVFLGIEEKKSIEDKCISLFANLLFIPTPLFAREENSQEIIYFNPTKLNWEKIGNITKEKLMNKYMWLQQSIRSAKIQTHQNL